MLPLELVGVCRLCLLKEQVDISIFENGSKETYYKISTCLPITISSEDELPKKICLNCYNKVNIFYDFWNQTLETEKHLLSWLNAETDTFNNFDKQSQPFSYSGITENLDDDDNIHNHNIDGDSDENHNDSDVENDIKKSMNERNFDEYDEFNVPKNNHILSVDYQDEKPGPSGFQEEQSSALKQLQGLDEELIYLYVESGEQIENETLGPLKKYCQENTTSDVFNSANNQNLSLEIEESPISVDSDKSNIAETNAYFVEFPNTHRPGDKLKTAKKRGATDEEKSENVLYSCPICDASFSAKVDYHRHELIHYTDYPYECGLCGKRFKRFKQFENHKTYHRLDDWFEEETNVTEIEECDYSTTEKQILEISHGDVVPTNQNCSFKQTHSRKKSCEICGKTFSSEILCKMHARKHDGEDIYVCESCGQQFSASKSHRCSKSRPVPD